MRVDLCRGTLVILAVLHDKAVVAADKRELHKTGPPIDTVTKIYPGGGSDIAFVTGETGFTVEGRSLNFRRLLIDTLNSSSISQRDLLTKSKRLQEVIGPELRFFIDSTPIWAPLAKPENSRFLLFGPHGDRFRLVDWDLRWSEDYRTFGLGPEQAWDFAVNPGDVAIKSYGKWEVYGEIREGTDKRFDRYREIPEVAKFRQKVHGASVPPFTDSEVRTILATLIKATAAEWLKLLPEPVAVSSAYDLAELSREGFRWITGHRVDYG